MKRDTHLACPGQTGCLPRFASAFPDFSKPDFRQNDFCPNRAGEFRFQFCNPPDFQSAGGIVERFCRRRSKSKARNFLPHPLHRGKKMCIRDRVCDPQQLHQTRGVLKIVLAAAHRAMLHFSRHATRPSYFCTSEIRRSRIAPVAEAILRLHLVPPVAGRNHPRCARGQ